MLGMIKVNLVRRWGRTALTCLGVAVGVTTVVALLALTGGLSRSAGSLAHLGRADFGVFQAGLADLTASSLPDSIVRRIEALPGVAAASPIQIVPNAVSADSSILTFGAEPESFLTRRLVLVSGQEPQGEQLFVGVGAANRLHIAPGQSLLVAGRAVRVAGIYRSGISLEDAGVELPLSTTQQLSRRPGEISMIAISIAPGYRETDLGRAVERAIPGTLALRDPGEVARVDTNSRIISICQPVGRGARHTRRRHTWSDRSAVLCVAGDARALDPGDQPMTEESTVPFTASRLLHVRFR